MEFQRTYQTGRQLNITSLIDVVFLLIVFFMLTSTFLRTESMEINFPVGAMPSASDAKPIILVVGDNERLYLRNQPLKLADLDEALHEPLSADPEHHVMIMSTNNVSVQELVRVMDAVYQVGGVNVSVSHWEY